MDTRSAAKTNVVSDTARVIGVIGGDIGLGGFAAAVNAGRKSLNFGG